MQYTSLLVQESEITIKKNCFCSGDTDAVVPVTATRYSIDALNLSTVTNWHPWYYDSGKVSILKKFLVFAQTTPADDAKLIHHDILRPKLYSC